MNNSIVFTFILELLVCILHVHAECPENTFEITSYYYYKSIQNEYWDIGYIVDEDFHMCFNENVTADSSTSTHTFCLPQIDSMQYSVHFIGDDIETVSFSHLVLYNEYHTVVFKVSVNEMHKSSFIINLSNPLTLSSIMLYTSELNEKWYSTSYNPSSWSSITSSTTKSVITTSDYYRYSFSISNLSQIVSFTLGIHYSGSIHIYMNDQLLFEASQTNDLLEPTIISSLDFNNYKKFIFSGSFLQNENLLAISITNSQSIPEYLHAFLVLNSESTVSQCSSLLDSYTILENSSTTSTSSPASNLFDFDASTTWMDTSSKDTFIDVQFNNNTFIQANLFSFGPTTLIDSLPLSFSLYGMNTLVSSDTFTPLFNIQTKTATYPIKQDIFFSMAAVSHVYNRFKFYSTNNNGGSSTAINELFLYTCNKPLEHLDYPQSIYRRSIYSAPITIVPVTGSFFNFTIEPTLPEGLTLDSTKGIITGAPHDIPEYSNYVITAFYPEESSFNLTLLYTQCENLLLKFDRFYGDLTQKNGTFSVINIDTNEIILTDQDLPDLFIDNHAYYTICVEGIHYNIVWNHSEDYDDDAYLSVYMQYMKEVSGANIFTDSSLIKTFVNTNYETTWTQFSLSIPIQTYSDWSYIQNELPENWYMFSFDDSQWKVSSYPSFDAIQHTEIYRKTFIINDEFDSFSSIELIVSYMHGILIYINEQKAFSQRIPDPLTVDSNSTSRYTKYSRQSIILPSSYLKSGNNLICVLLLADQSVPPGKTVSAYTHRFDLMMRQIGQTPTESLYNAVISSPSVSSPQNIHDHQYNTYSKFLKYENVTIESTTTSFTWISFYSIYVPPSLTWISYPHSWRLQGRYYEETPYKTDISTPWKTLHEVHNYTWTLKNKPEYFFIDTINVEAYNQYALLDLTNEYDSFTAVTLSEISFFSSSYNYSDISITYKSSELHLTYGLYMDAVEELNGNGFLNSFSVVPELPKGIWIDTNTGTIRGKPDVLCDRTAYTITALTKMNMKISTIIYIDIQKCDSNLELFSISLTLRYQDLYGKMIIYETEFPDTPIISRTSLPPFYETEDSMDLRIDKYSFYTTEYTYCEKPSSYTIILTLSSITSLNSGTSYTIKQNNNVIITTTYMTSESPEYIIHIDTRKPLEAIEKNKIVYTTIYQNTTSWIDNDHDEGTWNKQLAGILPKSNDLYIREHFTITDPMSHSMLHILLYVNSEIDVYINGVFIIHYIPLEKDIVYKTDVKQNLYCLTLSIPIQIYYITKRNNIISIHMIPYKLVQDTYFYFDTDITCLYELQSSLYMNAETIESSPIESTSSLNSLFDNNLSTAVSFINVLPITLDIMFSSHSLAYFNTLNIQFNTVHQPLSISMTGREEDEYEFITILNQTKIESKSKMISTLSVPMGVLGLKHIHIDMRFTNSSASTYLSISEFSFSFTKYQDSICVGDGIFPSVGEDEYSYAPCNTGYQGYQSRFCDGVRFRTPVTSKCIMLSPKNLYYTGIKTIITYTSYTSPSPKYTNIITSFITVPTLPKGLSITKEGIIQGMVTSPFEDTIYTVVGYNSYSQTSTKITLSAISAQCLQDNEFEPTNIGETITLECTSGSFGYRTRTCLVQGTTIYWSSIVEHCTSISMVVIILVLLCISISSIVYVYARKRYYKKKIDELNDLRKKEGSIVNSSVNGHIYDYNYKNTHSYYQI